MSKNITFATLTNLNASLCPLLLSHVFLLDEHNAISLKKLKEILSRTLFFDVSGKGFCKNAAE